MRLVREASRGRLARGLGMRLVNEASRGSGDETSERG